MVGCSDCLWVIYFCIRGWLIERIVSCVASRCVGSGGCGSEEDAVDCLSWSVCRCRTGSGRAQLGFRGNCSEEVTLVRLLVSMILNTCFGFKGDGGKVLREIQMGGGVGFDDGRRKGRVGQ